jgi:hypothetical protein
VTLSPFFELHLFGAVLDDNGFDYVVSDLDRDSRGYRAEQHPGDFTLKNDCAR